MCEGVCTGGGPEGCTACKEGYKMENERCEGKNDMHIY